MPLSKLKKWISGHELMERWNIDALNLSDVILDHKIQIYNSENLEENYYVQFAVNVPELAEDIAEYYFRVEEIIDFEKRNIDKWHKQENAKERNLRNDQRHKERSRAIAEMIWKSEPTITIVDMIQRDEIIEIACEGVIYTDKKTIPNWIKDLCPDRKPGRRPKLK